MIARVNGAENWFAKLLFTTTVTIHIYNFFTCFFFMGIEGWPDSPWFVIEILFEVFMVFELLMQWVLRTRVPWLWHEM
jgi:hypothetical protein